MTFPPDEAAFYVENPDGTTRRLAGDEPGLPLADYEIASALPGGYSTCNGDAILPERGVTKFGKFARYSVRLSDGTVIHEGRVEATPQRLDDGHLRLSCAGHQSAVVDADGIVFLGVLSDMSAWEEPPRSYIEGVGGTNSVNARFDVSAGEEGITIRMSDSNNVPATARGEMWLRAPAGEKIAEIQYVGSDSQETNMDPTLRVKDTPSGATIDSQSLVGGGYALDLGVYRWTPDDPGQYAVLRDTPSMTISPAKEARVLAMHALSLFGTHDLPRIPIEDLPDGLRFSDILAYLVQRHVGFATDRGGESTIEPSGFTLANAAWLESTNLAQIIEDGMAYEPGRTWAIFEGPTLHYGRRENMGKLWVAERSKGARLVDTGETAEPDFNCVVVVFTDSDGRQRRAGAPGGPGYDHEDAALLDLDPDNAVTAAGLGRRPYVLDIGDAKPDRAIELGALALEEVTKTRFTGEIELPRYAECEGKVLPTNMVKAWDRVKDSATGEELPLATANYSRSRADRPFSGTVDNPTNRVEGALARAGAKPRKVKRHKIRRRYRRARHRRQRQARRN